MSYRSKFIFWFTLVVLNIFVVATQVAVDATTFWTGWSTFWLMFSATFMTYNFVKWGEKTPDE